MREEHLVDTDWLEEHLADPALRVVDIRGHLRWEPRPDGTAVSEWTGARGDYAAGHIPGAIFLDFARDLADPEDPVPLQVARPEQLARVLGGAGIGDQHLVVAYDADRNVFATRLWWVFRYCGHRNIRVLDGGWPKWRRERRPITDAVPRYPPATFTVDHRPDLRATADEVLGMLGHPGVTLVDARAPEDYAGQPRWAARGGHIPGAVNLPAAALLDPGTGAYRPAHELRRLVDEAGIRPDRRAVTYCGLGLSATSAAFVLSMLGHPAASVYDGSWAEWGGRADLPIE